VLENRLLNTETSPFLVPHHALSDGAAGAGVSVLGGDFSLGEIRRVVDKFMVVVGRPKKESQEKFVKEVRVVSGTAGGRVHIPLHPPPRPTSAFKRGFTPLPSVTRLELVVHRYRNSELVANLPPPPGSSGASILSSIISPFTPSKKAVGGPGDGADGSRFLVRSLSQRAKERHRKERHRKRAGGKAARRLPALTPDSNDRAKGNCERANNLFLSCEQSGRKEIASAQTTSFACERSGQE
jgi:hypothetical protein